MCKLGSIQINCICRLKKKKEEEKENNSVSVLFAECIIPQKNAYFKWESGIQIPLFVLPLTFWVSGTAGILKNYIYFFPVSAVSFICADAQKYLCTGLFFPVVHRPFSSLSSVWL